MVRGVLLIWSKVEQGPTALAVGAGLGCLDIFLSRLSFLFSFSLSLGDGPIQTEKLSQRAVKPKNNQPINHKSHTYMLTCAKQLCKGAVGRDLSGSNNGVNACQPSGYCF